MCRLSNECHRRDRDLPRPLQLVKIFHRCQILRHSRWTWYHCTDEVPYVSNTITNHVQAMKMRNQAVNSIAPIYTLTTIRLVMMVRTVFLPLSPVAVYNVAWTPIDLGAKKFTFAWTQSPWVSRRPSTYHYRPTHFPSIKPALWPGSNIICESDTSGQYPTFPGAQWHVQLAETLPASFREKRLAYFEFGTVAALLWNLVEQLYYKAC